MDRARSLQNRGVAGVDSGGVPGIAIVSETNYPRSMASMKGITIKLPETTLRELQQRARRSGRSVSSLIREIVERPPQEGESVYAMVADLAGSLEGSRKAATNARRKFGR
jgi:predicted DNA-binding protein